MSHLQQFQDAFRQAKSRYPQLCDTNISLRFAKKLFFTMSATVQVSSLFIGPRKYVITINTRKLEPLSHLTSDDLVGWIGHELAHVIDYETMSNAQLIWFALRYIFDFGFRFSVERRIHAFAYNHGFADELSVMYKKFIATDEFGKGYKRYILNNCKPRWDDIRTVAEAHGIDKETYERS